MVILPEILHICLTNLNKKQSTFYFWGYDRYDDQKHWLVGHGTFGVCLKILGLQKPLAEIVNLQWSYSESTHFVGPYMPLQQLGVTPRFIELSTGFTHLQPSNNPCHHPRQPLQHLHPRITQFWQLSKESHVWPSRAPAKSLGVIGKLDLTPSPHCPPPIVSGDQVGF